MSILSKLKVYPPYVELYEEVIIKRRPKDNLFTTSMFDFEESEKVREIKEARRKEEEATYMESMFRRREKKDEGGPPSPLSIIDEEARFIKKMIESYDQGVKELDTFLNERKVVAKSELPPLRAQLKHILDTFREGVDSESKKNVLSEEVILRIGDIDEENEMFVESIKGTEQTFLKAYDEKQKDVIIRALVRYKKKQKIVVTMDKGTGVKEFLCEYIICL